MLGCTSRLASVSIAFINPASRYFFNSNVCGGKTIMLKWAAIFFGIAIVAAIFGFSGIAAGAAEIARILFFVFVAIFLVTLIMGMKRK